MTTMKPVLQHAHVNWIATGLIGVLLGMLVMVGVDQFESPAPKADTAIQQSLTGADLPRLDETTYYLQQSKSLQPQAESDAGLRDVSAAEQERTIGPGEGLNFEGSTSSVSGADLPATEHGRIIGPGEGLNFEGATPPSDEPAFWTKY